MFKDTKSTFRCIPAIDMLCHRDGQIKGWWCMDIVLIMKTRYSGWKWTGCHLVPAGRRGASNHWLAAQRTLYVPPLMIFGRNALAPPPTTNSTWESKFLSGAAAQPRPLPPRYNPDIPTSPRKWPTRSTTSRSARPALPATAGAPQLLPRPPLTVCPMRPSPRVISWAVWPTGPQRARIASVEDVRSTTVTTEVGGFFFFFSCLASYPRKPYVSWVPI